MIKTVIFDFDGVILESANIKTDAFRELFRRYSDDVDEIMEYHKNNMGISRFVKFRYFFEKILNEPLSKDKEIYIGQEFSDMVNEKVLACSFVKGAKEFLLGSRSKYKYFIVSGAPKEDLVDITKKRGIYGLFEDILGGDKNKAESISCIIEKHMYKKNEVVYIGDALGDMEAAEESGVAFIQRKSGDESSERFGKYCVKDFLGIDHILNSL